MNRVEVDPTARGLLVDFGGVLTTSVARSWRDFEKVEGLPKGTVFDILLSAYAESDEEHPLARFERGRATADDFDQALAAELAGRGHEIDPVDLAKRLFAGVRADEGTWRVVEAAHDAGARTALVSNSWGSDGYPEDRLGELFDTLVISGEVGLRKPDPAIYELACRRLELAPTSCAFVDDLQRNVDAAQALGMLGVHHRDARSTAAALSSFLGVDLTGVLTAP